MQNGFMKGSPIATRQRQELHKRLFPFLQENLDSIRISLRCPKLPQHWH